MDNSIVITGGDGFIGKNVATRLMTEDSGKEILIADFYRKPDNRFPSHTLQRLNPYQLLDALHKNAIKPKIIIHLGAQTDTTEDSVSLIMQDNLIYSMELCRLAQEKNMRLIYASSGAVYGHGGTYGFCDKQIDGLKPLNLYGWSKLWFDAWVKHTYDFNNIVGLRFFNVYGYGEEHKDKMASIITRGIKEIRETGSLTLFEGSEHFSRDFIFIDDIVAYIKFFMQFQDHNGLFNCGTGRDVSWATMARLLFQAMGKEEKINKVEMSKELRAQYQKRTCATITNFIQKTRRYVQTTSHWVGIRNCVDFYATMGYRG